MFRQVFQANRLCVLRGYSRLQTQQESGVSQNSENLSLII